MNIMSPISLSKLVFFSSQGYSHRKRGRGFERNCFSNYSTFIVVIFGVGKKSNVSTGKGWSGLYPGMGRESKQTVEKIKGFYDFSELSALAKRMSQLSNFHGNCYCLGKNISEHLPLLLYIWIWNVQRHPPLCSNMSPFQESSNDIMTRVFGRTYIFGFQKKMGFMESASIFSFIHWRLPVCIVRIPRHLLDLINV